MNTPNLLLAALTSSALLNAFIWICAAAIAFFLLNWFLGYIKAVDPFLTVARFIIGLIVLFFLLNAILSLVGKSFLPL